MLTYYHTRHSCGHAVYWSDALHGMATAPYPCIYCGGEAGKPLPPEANLVDMKGVWCFRTMNRDGTVPGFRGKIGTQVGIQHQTGNVCCDVTERSPKRGRTRGG